MHDGIMKLICRKSLFHYKCDTENESMTYTCEFCEDRYVSIHKILTIFILHYIFLNVSFL